MNLFLLLNTLAFALTTPSGVATEVAEKLGNVGKSEHPVTLNSISDNLDNVPACAVVGPGLFKRNLHCTNGGVTKRKSRVLFPTYNRNPGPRWDSGSSIQSTFGYQFPDGRRVRVIFGKKFEENHINPKAGASRRAVPVNTVISPGQHVELEYVRSDFFGNRLQYHLRSRNLVEVTEYDSRGKVPRLTTSRRRIDVVSDLEGSPQQGYVLRVIHFGAPKVPSPPMTQPFNLAQKWDVVAA